MHQSHISSFLSKTQDMPSTLSFRFLVVICFFLLGDSHLQTQQLDLLLKLKQYWKDPILMSHWNNSTLNTYCSWPELTCIGGMVTALKLTYVIDQPSATIPPFICDLKNITSLDLSYNSFHGEFPTALYNCSNLIHLNLSSNSFNGPIPSDIHHMANLQTLNLRNNKFSSIPTTTGQLESLQLLDLSRNMLTGILPDSVFSLKNLKELDLSGNSLSGEIPEVTAAFNLTAIDLSFNNFEGKIPQGFGKLRKLSLLYLESNKLSGEIPKSIAYLPDLTTILIYLNDFSGNLPPGLGKYSPLTELQVFSNRFTGGLPKNLCAKGNLVTLDASDNNLSGELFESLNNCSSLGTLKINSNRFTGGLPKNLCAKGNLGTLDASHNNLSGELFESLNNCSSLVTLRINSNIFSGRIPADISSWKWMLEFSASNNQISGPIPKHIAYLPDLNFLDLSENQLSGPIPDQLGDVYELLNLSSNHLVGRVPYKLRNHRESFLNNPGLSSSKHTSKVVISIVTASVVAACLGALSLYILVVKLCTRKKERRIKSTLTWKFIPFHVLSFRESNILSGMTEDNVVGQGGSGKVYRVWLGGTEGFVAVKRICSKRKVDQNLEKQFFAEVDILGKIRHLNIVKLLCCISSDSSKLLVYEYMENRSLDWWLHRNNWGSSVTGSGDNTSASLVWPMRLKIAIGAAQGLCYLHHDCSPPIIHRDVKSANILLDAEFNAKIADFGLAKLVTTVGEANTASAVAGSFGYIAPEYARTKRLNQKIDVYSFGVVLLELTTGRKANAGDEHTGLAQWAWQHMLESNHIPDALDEDIRNSPDHVEEMVNVFKLGIICTGMLPSARPSMKEVLQLLLSFHLQN